MGHSENIDTALFELGKAQEFHALATESLKQIQKSRAARFKELQDSKNNAAQRELYEEAVQQERAPESDVRLAMDQLKKRQSNYDKLKQRASTEKKGKKKNEAKKQKHSKQEKSTKSTDKDNKNTETIDDQGNEERDETRDREEFFRGNYQSCPPENLKSPENLATNFLAKPSAWKIECDQALSDRSQMETFPDPPYKGCGDRSCVQSRKQRLLKACRCNIIEAFMRDPNYPDCMKTERLRCHPDKFSVCVEKWRDDFQGKANEVFVVANFLYERDAKGV